jgi:hypothetical protein
MPHRSLRWRSVATHLDASRCEGDRSATRGQSWQAAVRAVYAQRCARSRRRAWADAGARGSVWRARRERGRERAGMEVKDARQGTLHGELQNDASRARGRRSGRPRRAQQGKREAGSGRGSGPHERVGGGRLHAQRAAASEAASRQRSSTGQHAAAASSKEAAARRRPAGAQQRQGPASQSMPPANVLSSAPPRPP